MEGIGERKILPSSGAGLCERFAVSGADCAIAAAQAVIEERAARKRRKKKGGK